MMRMRPLSRHRHGALMALAAALLATVLGAPAASAATAGRTGGIEGRVLDRSTGRPVRGATISLPDFGETAVSGRGGYFAFPKPFTAGSPYRPIRATVTAPG